MGIMINIIIIAVIIVIAFFAAKLSISHFKGNGSCCGGGGGTIADEKKLEGTKLGEKVLIIKGMTCVNCQNHVQNSLNKLEGIAAKVDYKKEKAVVEYSRQISNDELKDVVERAGYTLKEVIEK